MKRVRVSGLFVGVSAAPFVFSRRQGRKTSLGLGLGLGFRMILFTTIEDDIIVVLHAFIL